MSARVSRFFVDEELRVGRRLGLTGAHAHHLKNVLRLREGDAVTLFNGKGGEFLARIAGLDRNGVSVDLIGREAVERESPLTSELGLAIMKREAMDAAVRKSTELGATKIVPLIAEHTTVPLKQIRTRADRWREITHSACEQCGRNTLPKLEEPTPLPDWLSDVSAELRLAFHPASGTALESLAASPASLALLTGPEGGLSDREISSAAAAGFIPLSLGGRVLRGDTAPLAVLALVQYRWGDL